jgi:hypothetical protein
LASSTATFGSDYTYSPGTITIPGGQLTGSTIVTIVNDTVPEPDERIDFRIETPTNATVSNPSIFRLTIVNDDEVPMVTSAEFHAETAPHRVVMQFATDISATLSASDLVVKNLTTDTTIPASSIALSYDAPTNTATFTFPTFPLSVLPDGNYRARLPRTRVTGAAGNPLVHDGLVHFFVLAGDANRDRTINIIDFSTLAAHFNQPGTYADGDFNYSGLVNLNDFSILASKFNQSLAELLPPARYSISVLPRPDTTMTPIVRPMAINDNGLVAGNLTFAEDILLLNSFTWTVGAPAIATGPSDVFVNALNNAGTVVGHRVIRTVSQAYTVAVANNVILGNPGFDTFGKHYFASGINDAGVIVGHDSSQPADQFGVRWLNGPGSYQQVIADTHLTDVNNNGEMIGTRGLGVVIEPVYFAPGSLSPVELLTPNDVGGAVRDINDNGTIIGLPSGSNTLPLKWNTPGSAPFEMEPFQDGLSAHADHLNNQGVIIGRTLNFNAPSTPTIWHEDLPYDVRELIDGLGDLQIDDLTGINNLGQIVGVLEPTITGEVRGFVLTPIPNGGRLAPSATLNDPAEPDLAADGEARSGGPAVNALAFASGRASSPFSNRVLDLLGQDSGVMTG